MDDKMKLISHLIHEITLVQRVFVFRAGSNSEPLSLSEKEALHATNELLHAIANYGKGFYGDESLRREINSFHRTFEELSFSPEKQYWLRKLLPGIGDRVSNKL